MPTHGVDGPSRESEDTTCALESGPPNGTPPPRQGATSTVHAGRVDYPTDVAAQVKDLDAEYAATPTGKAKLRWQRDQAQAQLEAQEREAAMAEPIEGEVPPSAATPGAPRARAVGLRPTIRIDHDLARMTDELETALVAAPELGLYQRAGAIVRIRRDAPPPRGLRRAAGALTIGRAGSGHLIECASRAARWVKRDGRRKKAEVETRPDRAVVTTYAERSSWRLPPLTGIITGPTLRPDGSILARPGYDADTGLFLAADACPEIPSTPTRDDALRALGELLEVYRDFPFIADCDRAATIAAIFTVVGRTAIAGSVPAFPVTATAPGTGKTLLVDTVSVIGTGAPASKIPQSGSDEETRKLMLAIALAGDQVVLWDNLHLPFGGASIDLAITAGTVKDRVLGLSEVRAAPWTAIIFATGQNLSYKGDVTRRVIPIRLDAQNEHPERRTGFARPDLLAWVTRERPRLLVAALVILRAYVHAGRPGAAALPELGSFEEWSSLVRSALVWLGQADPARCQDAIESADDEDRQTLARLLTAWRDQFGSAARTLSEALAVENAGPLHDALLALDARWDGRAPPNVKRIGRALRHYSRRVVGERRLVRAGDTPNGVALWKVEVVP